MGRNTRISSTRKEKLLHDRPAQQSNPPTTGQPVSFLISIRHRWRVGQKRLDNVNESRADFIQSPKRYAFAALHGKVREWYRSGASKEIPVGIGTTLEHWIAADRSMQVVMDRAILFEQLKSKLNDRDRQILVLLQQDKTSPASVAAALGVSYAAAAKAIQRVKDRLAAILASAPIDDQGQTSPLLYGTKD